MPLNLNPIQDVLISYDKNIVLLKIIISSKNTGARIEILPGLSSLERIHRRSVLHRRLHPATIARAHANGREIEGERMSDRPRATTRYTLEANLPESFFTASPSRESGRASREDISRN